MYISKYENIKLFYDFIALIQKRKAIRINVTITEK